MLLKFLLEAVEKVKIEPFKLTNGTSSNVEMKSGSPNLKWRPTNNPLVINRKRTAAEYKISKKYLIDLKKDLENYKKYLNDTNQMKKGLEAGLKNADKILIACEYFDSKVNEFNELIGDLNEAAKNDDIESFEKMGHELWSMCAGSREYSKTVKSKLTYPSFMGTAKTLSAIGFDYMFSARDNADKYLKRMKMSPAQRAAALKTSQRMKTAWME